MPRLYEEWGLRDLLGRSCHVGVVVSVRMKSRKLHGCHYDAGELSLIHIYVYKRQARCR